MLAELQQGAQIETACGKCPQVCAEPRQLVQGGLCDSARSQLEGGAALICCWHQLRCVLTGSGELSAPTAPTAPTAPFVDGTAASPAVSSVDGAAAAFSKADPFNFCRFPTQNQGRYKVMRILLLHLREPSLSPCHRRRRSPTCGRCLASPNKPASELEPASELFQFSQFRDDRAPN